MERRWRELTIKEGRRGDERSEEEKTDEQVKREGEMSIRVEMMRRGGGEGELKGVEEKI